MTRTALSSTNRTEASKPVIRRCQFIELNFPGGVLRITTGQREVTWGGMTFTPIVPLLDQGEFQEFTTLKSSKTTMRFSGVAGPLLDRIMADKYHFAEVNVWEGFFDEAWKLIADPYVVDEKLLMSTAVLIADDGTKIIELSVDGWELFGLRDSPVLATPQAQRLRYPGDTGQDRIAVIQNEEVTWGGTFQRAT